MKHLFHITNISDKENLLGCSSCLSHLVFLPDNSQGMMWSWRLIMISALTAGVAGFGVYGREKSDPSIQLWHPRNVWCAQY